LRKLFSCKAADVIGGRTTDNIRGFALRAIGFILLMSLGAGCASPAEQQAQRAVSEYFEGNYRAAAETLTPLAKKPDENFVLNNVRLGSSTLVDYDLEDAEDAFLRAYEVINSVGVNNGGRSLGATLVDEKIKIWKGEPYERAMTNFYLGLIYYMHQDYNNARGAFENALFKLRDYADSTDEKSNYSEQESNFVIGLVMVGKCQQKLGREDLAKANFDRARQLRPQLGELADYDRNANSNLLLVVEYGYGPEKVTNRDGAIVGFAPTPGEAGIIPEPRVTIDDRPIDVNGIDRPPIDFLALAQDRRWQSIDTIRAIKSTVGTGLIVGGAGVGAYGVNQRNRDAEIAGLAMIGTGILLKATSHADVRQWEMLPRTVFLLPLHVSPGKHDVTIYFPHSAGLRQTWRSIDVPEKGEATYYIRMQRSTSGVYTWPPVSSAPQDVSPPK
jgi:tetratricopeptide (TPR) repeat protein